jgi:hypothetical protein
VSHSAIISLLGLADGFEQRTWIAGGELTWQLFLKHLTDCE